MDSLLATYASSDEEDDQPRRQQPPQQPPPSKPTHSHSLFSSLPPVSHSTPLSLPLPTPKKLVQFRPPSFTKPPSNDSDNDSESDDEIERKKRKQLSHQPTSLKSLLSTIPAPKYSNPTSSLGVAPGSRRSVIDTELPAPAPSAPPPIADAPIVEDNNSWNDGNLSYNESYVQPPQYYDGSVSWNNDDYCNSNSNSNSNSSSVLSSGIDSFIGKASGKRRKDQIPVEIMEVKQDELMKNRPTEDKSKLTGMAFGPSYQPTSSKGKPAKLHKRKHQIGSLYYDMKQKEGEFQDRRAKGFLTKSETQAKYGW